MGKENDLTLDESVQIAEGMKYWRNVASYSTRTVEYIASVGPVSVRVSECGTGSQTTRTLMISYLNHDLADYRETVPEMSVTSNRKGKINKLCRHIEKIQGGNFSRSRNTSRAEAIRKTRKILEGSK